MLMKDQKCKVEGCENKARTKGLCPKHYRRLLLYGDPTIKKRGAAGERLICSVDGCNKQVHAKGYCLQHYKRFRKYGTTDASVLKKASPGTLKKLVCQVEGCDRPASSSRHKMCEMHYNRFRKHGTVSDDVLVNYRSLSIETRLMKSIKINRETGCWEWQRGLFSTGYGQISVKGVGRLAHIVSYETFVGSIPDGLFVLHKCDNPICINPEHLFLGTNQDNMTDMVNKGRSARGERNRHAKLTVDQVLEIKQRLLNGEDTIKISEDYPVTERTIKFIQEGKSWKHINI